MARVLIAGAGFAGMWAALGAARARRDLGGAAGDIRIDVVAPTPLLCLKPRLYERHAVAFEADIGPLLAAVNVGYLAGAVDAVEAPAGQVLVRTPDGKRRREAYDSLVLAMGSHTVPPPAAWRAHVWMLDSAADALALRDHVNGLPQRAPSAARYTAAVIGAGFTGLEIATELAGWLGDLARQSGESARVVLLDRAARAGASLGEGPQEAITEALALAGVSFRPTASIRQVGPDGIVLENGEQIAAATVVWAAGMRAHPLGAAVGPTDAEGRLGVDAALRVDGQARIFAAGDMARAAATPGNTTLMSCQHAMPTGRVSGNNALRVLAGAEPIAYTQPMYVTCLDLGAAGGLLTHGWQRSVLWTGAEAKAVKRIINGRIIAPPPADAERALQAADPTPLPAVGPEALVSRWRALLANA
jgi:NADH dehydrogenase